jgi:hypothetical protein
MHGLSNCRGEIVDITDGKSTATILQSFSSVQRRLKEYPWFITDILEIVFYDIHKKKRWEESVVNCLVKTHGVCRIWDFIESIKHNHRLHGGRLMILKTIILKLIL